MTFTIPGAPVGKGRPRMTKTGHVYTPQATLDYEELVRTSYLAAAHGEPIPAGHPVAVQIMAYYPLRKKETKKNRAAKLDGTQRPTLKPDCDNLIKAVLDALNGLAYHDDAQVVELYINKAYSEEPRVWVQIEEVGEDV